MKDASAAFKSNRKIVLNQTQGASDGMAVDCDNEERQTGTVRRTGRREGHGKSRLSLHCIGTASMQKGGAKQGGGERNTVRKIEVYMGGKTCVCTPLCTGNGKSSVEGER